MVMPQKELEDEVRKLFVLVCQLIDWIETNEPLMTSDFQLIKQKAAELDVTIRKNRKKATMSNQHGSDDLMR